MRSILKLVETQAASRVLDKRGCKQVLESGTGSGSLTTSLARAVAPHGHVHTYEFHVERQAKAAAEFTSNGLGDLVHCAVHDVEADGFPESCHGSADALVLDVPSPWKVRALRRCAIAHSVQMRRALPQTSRIISESESTFALCQVPRWRRPTHGQNRGCKCLGFYAGDSERGAVPAPQRPLLRLFTLH